MASVFQRWARLGDVYSFVALSSVVSDTRSYGYALSLVNSVPEVGGKCGSSTSLNLGTPTNLNSTGSGTSLIPDLPTTTGGVWAIDSNGDVAGMANLNGKKQAFYLAAGSSSAATLPFLNTGDAYAFGYGVNTAGQVVGLSAATSSTPEACVWTQTGGTWGAPVALPNLAGAASPYGQASTVNSSGVVAGWGYTSANLDAVTWSYNSSTSSWVATDISSSSRTAYPLGSKEAMAINSNGTIVAGYGQPYAPSPGLMPSRGSTAYIHHPRRHQRLRQHRHLSGQTNGVNESGVIVGGSNGHAFIWDSVNHMRDMNTIFGSTGYGIIPSGWTLVNAEAIDNNGNIVGYGTNSLGVQTGFLIKATVPEPSTLLLAATAVAGLLAYAWRKRK